jgi:hypothetical protein
MMWTEEVPKLRLNEEPEMSDRKYSKVNKGEGVKLLHSVTLENYDMPMQSRGKISTVDI